MEGDPGLEVYVKNVPQQATEKTLAGFLKPFMLKLSIRHYHCQKTRDKNFANITFLKRDDGNKFLREHGQLEVPAPSRRRNNNNNNSIGPVRTDARFNARVKLSYLNHTLYPVISTRASNKYLLKVLAKEEKESKTLPEVVRSGTERREKPVLPVSLGCSYVSCGTWAYATNGELVFMTEYTWPVNNYAKFSERRLLLNFESGLRMIIPYSSTKEILSQIDPPTITFTLRESPRFYRKADRDVGTESLLQQLAGLNIRNEKTSGPSWQRLTSLDGNHARIAGICLVYRLGLSESSSTIPGHINVVGEKIQALRNARDIPPLVHYRTRVSQVGVSAATAFSALSQALSSETIPFKLAFQLQKLAQNNYLSASKVLGLLPEIHSMLQRSELSVCVRAVRKLFSQIDFPGSGTEAWDFDSVNLVEMLQTNEEHNSTDSLFPEDHISKAAWENVAIIHRATVTPAGTYLYGPEPETKNRVLRKYPGNHEYFLRVEFSDENGQQVYFEPQASLDEIYHNRFKDVLRSGLTIAGRNFQFLGFSHSSLRARTAWFMAPFFFDGNILSDRMVIKDLGDFSHIKSPAKCAARIGQAFSDTPNTIHIDPNIVHTLEDVQFQDRVFSDGVGTISWSVREKILDGMNRGKGRTNLATCFQIRYKGAKGMVALDSRIPGDFFALRPSMIKFEGSTDPDLELCGAARKPLPFKLNRQFIKILEDLQVEESFFFNLQVREVHRLRQITDDAYNASIFLKTQAVGDSMHLPALMRELIRLDIDFREDKFLRDILEMSILLELRDLKHRARIPVPNGHVLHGIMDETGLLEEGQVFVTADDEYGNRTIIARKHIVVTRAPAMHPGDVQIAEAIIPPKDSPLMELSNCICFSQKGQRDLPSQLSGGDLDGDLYHVMWDPAGLPKWTFPPADYPRQTPENLDRVVTRDDMTDFFVKFMETDQLGRICNNHMILADQKEQGTMDPRCIALAELASIAVDFSKTGIPVDKANIQRPDGPWRPDFMAPGPHVNIEKRDSISFNKLGEQRDQADEDDDEENRWRYYESDKVLGKLYRAIDEYGIFKHIQERLTIEDGHSVRIDPGSEELTVIPMVWEHVQRTCRGFQWENYLEEARGIREIYENSLLNIISDYSEHPRQPISEKEAFIGNILGKTGAQTKRQRDLSSSMKEQFDRDATFVVGCILKDVGGYSEEALERSVACLQVSLEEREVSRNSEQLSSFKYLAASICLREINRRFEGGWH